eukprot:1958475-Pleurochrysis_carterae.AAC.3
MSLGVASPDILLSRSRSLLQSLASIIAASERGDYGRTDSQLLSDAAPSGSLTQSPFTRRPYGAIENCYGGLTPPQ